MHIVNEQPIEVNRCKVQLRESAARNQASDTFTSIRKQNVRAVSTQAMSQLRAFDTVKGEDTRLLNFTEESSLFA